MELSGKNILVTGGAGFIGSHLVDQLLEEGCFVRVLDNLKNGKLENICHHDKKSNFEFFPGSVTDPFDVAQGMKNIDIVFHLACLGVRHSIKHPFENHRVNAEGTLLVLQEARKKRVAKFIHCSSSEVYGTAQYVPMPENHPTLPCTVYGAGKLAGEAYARAYHTTYGLNTVVIRPFNVYGPRSHHEGDAGEFIPKSIVRVLNDEPILVFGDGSQTRDFTYVEDTARGLVAAAESDDAIGHTLNIGSNFEISIKRLAERILENAGNSASWIQHSESRPGDVLRLFADSNIFLKMTNWQPAVSFEDGLVKTIHWFKARPEKASALFAQEAGVNW
ncbi:MAG: hypothetical protein VR65_02430 [Desulfobulbaceae bacterium BRH_c16a]|nr:MAG: hypothetical protein VR65_02430 [Desulfobulbaceae bacterium BRH_c16a]